MLCDHAREHLSAYLDKELSADLSAAVRAHLDTCPDCRSLLNDLRATSDLLRRLPVHAAPDGLAGDVLREMERRSLLQSSETAAGQPHERTLAIHRARPWPRALAVAATLVLAAGIGLFAYLGGRTGEMAPSLDSRDLASASAPDAAATKTGDDWGVPAGATQLALRKRGVVEMVERLDEAGLAVADGLSLGYRARRPLGVDYDVDETARLGRALADAPTAGVANIEDVAGQQTIFGNSVVVRSGAATQRLTPGYETVHEQGLALASTSARKGGPVTTDLYAYMSNGSARRFYGKAAATHTKLKKLAPPTSDAVAMGTAVRAGGQVADRDADGDPAPLTGPAAVQHAMNYVAEGRAPFGTLAAVATRDNLVRAENQLVVRAASRDKANGALVELFHANGWAALPRSQALAYFRQDGVRAEAVRGMKRGGAGGAGHAAEGLATAGGCYFLAGRNGEDTWVVLTDRDRLSRFGGQLAQAGEMTVEDDSSEPFRTIGQLQKQVRAYALAKADVAFEEETSAYGRSTGRAAPEAAPATAAPSRQAKARSGRSEPGGEPEPDATLAGDVPAEKAAEQEAREGFGISVAEQMARQKASARGRLGDDVKAKRATLHRAPAAAGGAPAVAAAGERVPPVDRAEAAEALRAETPSVTMHGRTKPTGKKAADQLASGAGLGTAARPSAVTPGEPAAPAVPPAPTFQPAVTSKPAARWAFGTAGPAPTDKVGASRSADERRTARRKDAVSKGEAKTEDSRKRRLSGGYAYKEADRFEKADAAKRGPAKRPADRPLGEAVVLQRGVAKPQITLGIAGGTVTVHPVFTLPKNQVLLIVRVRQVSETAATAAEKDAGAETRPEALKEVAP